MLISSFFWEFITPKKKCIAHNYYINLKTNKKSLLQNEFKIKWTLIWLFQLRFSDIHLFCKRKFFLSIITCKWLNKLFSKEGPETETNKTRCVLFKEMFWSRTNIYSIVSIHCFNRMCITLTNKKFHYAIYQCTLPCGY
jgi:hypothetical protein